MGALARNGRLVDRERVAFHDAELLAKLLLELGEGWDAAAVALYRNDGRAGIKKRVGQPARTRTDFVDALAFKRSRNCSDSREQLAIEDEVLAQGLACA